MRKLFLSLALVYVVSIRAAYQQVIFKPQRQITGPFGSFSGTAFNFGMDSDSFNPLPSTMIISQKSGGINSISFTYPQQIGPITKTGGIQTGAVSETQLSKIVGVQVCTGTSSGSTVIIGLQFTYDNGLVGDFRGDTTSVRDLSCVNAAPTTPGYYLQSLSGSYGIYISQLVLYWVSNFEQEIACRDDFNCQQSFNFCPSSFCCYQRSLNDNGQWENGGLCA